MNFYIINITVKEISVIFKYVYNTTFIILVKKFSKMKSVKISSSSLFSFIIFFILNFISFT